MVIRLHRAQDSRVYLRRGNTITYTIMYTIQYDGSLLTKLYIRLHMQVYLTVGIRWPSALPYTTVPNFFDSSCLLLCSAVSITMHTSPSVPSIKK